VSLSESDLSKVAEKAATAYEEALGVWYPQHGANAPSERNLTLHFALALQQIAPSVSVYAEASLGVSNDKKERIDLVGIEPNSRTLVVVEAKRILEKSPGGLLKDVDRIHRFDTKNDNSEVKHAQKFGVLLTQTICPSHAVWWAGGNAGTPPGRGQPWPNLGQFLLATRRGEQLVASWYAAGKRYERHFLWCIWPCSGPTVPDKCP